MLMNLDANGFVILDREECLERLARHRVASIAVTERALPVVLPALYVLRGTDILVGASPDGILGRCLPNNVVSLCVYDLARDLSSGWTVSVTGRAELVVDLVEFRCWATADLTQVVVRIGTEHITGREIRRAA
jgi:nitroimidazol reductase NimA-like FMN-containing flavoprotein (pyridoxamine 5'-phosphate oxidase superfamily)